MIDSMVDLSASTSASSWKQRYEALRHLALSGSPLAGAEPLGLALLLRQGVAGWMRCWPRPVEAVAGAVVPRVASPVVPTPQSQQKLTTLLAEMSLAHLSPIATL